MMVQLYTTPATSHDAKPQFRSHDNAMTAYSSTGEKLNVAEFKETLTMGTPARFSHTKPMRMTQYTGFT